MVTVNLTLRSVKGSRLSASEADSNFVALRDAINAVDTKAGVAAINGRTGDVVLELSDISGALPALQAGKYLTSDGTLLTWANAIPASTDNIQVNSLGVGTPASGVTGEIRATNDITAGYSDGRLKDIVGYVTDALAKVRQLEGILYTPNALGKSFGLNDGQYVGLDANAVRQVLPEATKLAPFDTKVDTNGKLVSVSGEDYLTVDYGRLVPLLVEAIKDLSVLVESVMASSRKE